MIKWQISTLSVNVLCHVILGVKNLIFCLRKASYICLPPSLHFIEFFWSVLGHLSHIWSLGWWSPVWFVIKHLVRVINLCAFIWEQMWVFFLPLFSRKRWEDIVNQVQWDSLSGWLVVNDCPNSSNLSSFVWAITILQNDALWSVVQIQ